MGCAVGHVLRRDLRLKTAQDRLEGGSTIAELSPWQSDRPNRVRAEELLRGSPGAIRVGVNLQGVEDKMGSGSSGEICWRCSTYVEAGLAFCTRCGAGLDDAPAPEVVVDEESEPVEVESLEPVAASAPVSGAAVQAGEASGGWRWVVVGGFLGLVVLAVLFGVLWRGEASKHHSTVRALQAKEGEYTALGAAYKKLDAQLQATKALSDRRASVLRQTEKVLRRVEPLLSTVDRLQNLTGDIQQQRDAFTMSSEALVSDLITFGNYLIDTPTDLLDVSYASSLIDGINAEINTTNNDLDSLSADDSQYADASATFSQKATPFSGAVRELQRQLRAVVRS